MSKSISSAEKRGYDGTVARIAGNLLSSNSREWWVSGDKRQDAVEAAVATARAIVAETKRTEPSSEVAASEVIPASVRTTRGGLEIQEGQE